ncbi:Protein of unknown function [Bacillus mycoides]|nr:Protein of unknown function [Bacillus mycoides]
MNNEKMDRVDRLEEG